MGIYLASYTSYLPCPSLYQGPTFLTASHYAHTPLILPRAPCLIFEFTVPIVLPAHFLLPYLSPCSVLSCLLPCPGYLPLAYHLIHLFNPIIIYTYYTLYISGHLPICYTYFKLLTYIVYSDPGNISTSNRLSIAYGTTVAY